MNKKIATAIGLGGLVIGAIGGGFIADDSHQLDAQAAQIQTYKDSLASKDAQITEMDATIADLEATKADFEAFKEDYKQAIDEQSAEDKALALAKEEVSDKTRDLEDFLESKLGWIVKDDDDITLRYDEVDVLKSNYDDEVYKFKLLGVKVAYEDDDHDYTDYLDITVLVKDGEVKDIIYEEA